ncbi:MAG: hypothetical protein ACREL7_08345 [Longimicrobiales bacterium]
MIERSKLRPGRPGPAGGGGGEGGSPAGEAGSAGDGGGETGTDRDEGVGACGGVSDAWETSFADCTGSIRSVNAARSSELLLAGDRQNPTGPRAVRRADRINSFVHQAWSRH